MKVLCSIMFGVLLIPCVEAFPMGKIVYSVLVLDELSGCPIKDVPVKGVFTDIPSFWGGHSVERVTRMRTDVNGSCRFTGTSNHGTSFYKIEKIDGYYDVPLVKYVATNRKRDFLPYRCEPYDCVFTTMLQRVEHPIPLCVKNVELRCHNRPIYDFDDTNTVLRYDLVLGDWLPPVGHGKVADLTMETYSNFVERVKGGIIDFDCYERRLSVALPGVGNGIVPITAKPTDGIKVRQAPESGYAPAVMKRFGRKKSIRGVVVSPKMYSDEEPNRCYVFRIRSRYDEKGNLVEAYYGKIYGDFNFSKVWHYGERQFFLYYLNPKSLDRNLEWDMKNNLCPNPGSLSRPQP